MPESALSFTLKPHESATLSFRFHDPDDHFTTIGMENASQAVVTYGDKTVKKNVVKI